MLKSLEEILNAENYLTFTACDLDSAWHVYQQQLPDLVITDISLKLDDANDQGGLTLMNKIIQQGGSNETCPIILISANASAIDKAKESSNYQIDFLTKPFDPEILLSKIAAYFP